MKKIIILLLVLALLLCSCGSKDDKENSSGQSDGESKSDILSDGDVSENPDDTESADIDTATAAEPDIMPANASFDGLSDEKIAYGCGTQVDENNRSIGASDMQGQYGDYNALFIGEPEKKIYLTFDEGYENGYTEKILDILKEKGVGATFYVTLDYADKNEDIIKRMIDEGHAVGNHSCSHPSMPELSESEMIEEIKGLDDYIFENFGYKMTTFRPPMGEFSEKSLAVTKSLGYKTVLWSFAYKDWLTDDQPDTDAAFERITSSTHDGAVYLLHAVSSTNTAVLGSVIDYWRNMGYEISAVV